MEHITAGVLEKPGLMQTNPDASDGRFNPVTKGVDTRHLHDGGEGPGSSKKKKAKGETSTAPLAPSEAPAASSPGSNSSPGRRATLRRQSTGGRYAVGEEPVLPEPGEATGASATAKRALERRNSNIVLSTPEATTAALAGMSSDGFKKSDGFGSKASSTPSPSKKKGKDIDIVVPVLHTVLVKAVQDNAAGGVEIDATCIQRCLLDGLPPSIQKMIKEQEVLRCLRLEPCSLLLCVCADR